jgi:hypothetical protein
VQTICYTDCFVRSNNSKNNLKNCAQFTSICVPSSSCCTDYTNLYSMTSNNRKTNQHSNRKFLLGICALALLENVPALLLSFLSQAYSEISLVPSLNVSCTLPNAFFYKSQNDPFSPKFLFTFPNPKSKGQDLILPLQDQGP